MDKRVQDIVTRALDGKAPNKEECIYLLGFEDYTPESTLMRGAANDIARAKNGNSAVIVGQIGLELYPCEIDCEFCSFGVNHTGFTDKVTLDEETIRQKVHDFTKDGDLYLLWLMTMNTFDLDYYLNALRIAREVAPPQTKLFTNIGDTDYETFVKLKEAGADGVYHICRLGEGEYTTISPDRRHQTRENAMRAGLAIQGCIEPIGPEHTPEELVENMFETRELALDTAGVMKRVAVPGTRFTTEITYLRQAQISAVNTLAMSALDPMPTVLGCLLEPSGLVSGATSTCAETGVNPRDTVADTSAGRGLDVPACRRLLWNAGFRYLRRGDGTLVELTEDYIAACDANE
jgi:biotin synthase